VTRGVYIAWLWVLGVALGLCVLAATLGTVLRLEGPTTVDCSDVEDAPSGHVRLEGCVVDATDAFLVDEERGLTAVWIVPPDWTGRPIAWTYSTAPAHVRWARARQLDEDERRRYLDRHRDELRTQTPIQGWLRANAFPREGTARTVRPTPQLSLDRPLEPLSVGGSLAAALLLFLLLGLVNQRRRWLRAQARWAHDEGLGTVADVAPTDF
jgi:hypothetical protein